MSSAEFTEWMAYAQIEPFGEQATQYQLAQIAAAIYNVNRDPRKTKPIKVEDFMITYKRYEPTNDAPTSVFARLKASLIASGALAGAPATAQEGSDG